MARTYKTYRATQKVHLGGTEPPAHIDNGEVFDYDGKNVRREDGFRCVGRGVTC